MNTLKFKTNINCGNCLAKVGPILDAETGIEKWEVDLKSDDRTLTVETAGLTETAIKETVQKAGFRAELQQ